MSRIAAKTRGRRGHDMQPSARATIWAVARAELMLQRRSPLLWVVAALLVARVLPPLLWAPYADFPSLSVHNATRWQDVFSFFNFTALWCALVAPLCALVVLSRDRDRRVTDLLWSRPLDVGTYVSGKALGLALIVVPLSAGSEALYWVLASLRRSTPVPAPLMVVEWVGVVLPIVLLSTAVVLVVGLVLAHPAAALVSWWVAVLGLMYVEIQAMAQEYGGPAPSAFPVHVGPWRFSTDVGRYPAVLIGGALIAVGLALGLLGTAPILLRLRERSSIITRASLLCMSGLFWAALLCIGSGTFLLRAVASNVVR